MVEIFTFLKVIHRLCPWNRMRRVMQSRVRNIMREELALVRQNGGWKPGRKMDDLAFFTLEMGYTFSFADLIYFFWLIWVNLSPIYF